MIDASYLKKLAAQTPFRVAAGIALVLFLALLTSDRILLLNGYETGESCGAPG